MIAHLKAYGSGLLGLFLFRAGDRLYYDLPFRKEADLTKVCEAAGLEPAGIRFFSPLVGIFNAGNRHGVVCGAEECSQNFQGATVIQTRYTALGNLILVNDKGALIAPVLEGELKVLAKALGVPCTVGTLAGLQTVGTLGLANNRGAVVHPETTEAEMELVKKALKLETVGPGTAAKSGFVGAMAIATDRALILSPEILTPEMVQMADLLGVE
ncbi:MAG TPA: hypothetical protein ENN60_02840 [archaeon]|nr:hypothetical protein [archaeon]